MDRDVTFRLGEAGAQLLWLIFLVLPHFTRVYYLAPRFANAMLHKNQH